MAAFFHGWGWDGSDNKLFGAGASFKETLSHFWWRSRFFAYGGQYFDENMKPLINTKPGIRALEELVNTIQYYPPGVLLFESEEPKTMLIKGEVPMLVSWTSTGKRVGDPNQSLIIGKAGFGVIPGHRVNGQIIRAVPNTGGRSFAPKEAADQAAEEWDKITKRRGLKRQQEFWKQQMAAMKEAGVTFRPELADQ